MKDVNRFPRRVGEDSKDEISSRGPKEANLLITARRPFRRETREASSRGEVWQEAGNNLPSKVNSIFQFRGDFLPALPFPGREIPPVSVDDHPVTNASLSQRLTKVNEFFVAPIVNCPSKRNA